MLGSLLSLFVLPVLGLFAFLVFRKVLKLRLWFIAMLFLGVGLLLHFAVLSTCFVVLTSIVLRMSALEITVYHMIVLTFWCEALLNG